MALDILPSDEVVSIVDQIADDALNNFLSDPGNGAKMSRAVVSAAIHLKRDI
jgi:formiminotetrahydrofolate cyclodeaminase